MGNIFEKLQLLSFCTHHAIDDSCAPISTAFFPEWLVTFSASLRRE